MNIFSKNNKEFYAIYSIVLFLLIPIYLGIAVKSGMNSSEISFYVVIEMGLYLLLNALLWLTVLSYSKWHFQKIIAKKFDRFKIFGPKNQMMICVFTGVVYGFLKISRVFEIINVGYFNASLLLVVLLMLLNLLLTSLYSRILVGERYIVYNNHVLDMSSVVSYKVITPKIAGKLSKIVLSTERERIEIFNTKKILSEIENELRKKIKHSIN